jgi:hypothetical protein
MVKKHLEQKDHPINELIVHFDNTFFNLYSREIEQGMRNLSSPNEPLMRKLILELQTWVRLLFFTVLRFYRINL